MLRKLATVGTVMHVTAHPDDENNSLLAMESQGEGLRVVLATATRGNGGQNEIGPEIFEALGVLRTEELLAAHRVDGAEQFFARAVDFGYSFSIDESFEKWGKDEIVGDYVRLIRLTRPDVMITMRPDGAGGGQHHQASARIGAEASAPRAIPRGIPIRSRKGCAPGSRRRSIRLPTTACSRATSRRRRDISSRSTAIPTTSCSGRRTPRSAAKRARCTSARASASCSRCRGHGS
jgi:LmbE family N-acetylglucosaminyl deacetylase